MPGTRGGSVAEMPYDQTMLLLIVMGWAVTLYVAYKIIRAAVEHGTLTALRKHTREMEEIRNPPKKP